jgi:hypothetical protein
MAVQDVIVVSLFRLGATVAAVRHAPSQPLHTNSHVSSRPTDQKIARQHICARPTAPETYLAQVSISIVCTRPIRPAWAK